MPTQIERNRAAAWTRYDANYWQQRAFDLTREYDLLGVDGRDEIQYAQTKADELLDQYDALTH